MRRGMGSGQGCVASPAQLPPKPFVLPVGCPALHSSPRTGLLGLWDHRPALHFCHFSFQEYSTDGAFGSCLCARCGSLETIQAIVRTNSWFLSLPTVLLREWRGALSLLRGVWGVPTAPRDTRCDSRGERSPWLPLETELKNVSPGVLVPRVSILVLN